ncbi:hypothetical protein [Roseateles terrae]|uniref:Uncharacterized protein n=1 Tax=Roseateles terrae TaxID=431060 RepID=A0ABR6GPX7_9BURK|nr:hypothetical protein [Roseateles terrae]MBB3194179.1 hypothetical protein [Roseateles terrae]OWQ88030.1 hypothetical protein CDN98_07760 [Roseateles terrae]
MGLISRLFSRHSYDLTASASSRPSFFKSSKPRELALPQRATTADAHAWQGQMAHARMLVGEINDLPEIRHALDTQKRLSHGSSLPLQPGTLLSPASSAAKPRGERLNGNCLPSGAVAMATPTLSQRRLWQDSADTHDITHVVRLGTPKETQRLHLDTGGSSLPLLKSTHGTLQPLSRHWDVEIEPDTAIAPSVLRETFDRMSAHPLASGRRVAFQSPGGDNRSAVFAAGWQIYRELTAQRQANRVLSEQDVMDIVHDAVMETRLHRSTRLLDQPEHLASLLAMAQQMRTSATGAPMPFRAVRQGPGSNASSHDAMARSLCQQIRQRPTVASAAYSPLKGSNEASLHVRPERMLTADPRLTAMPGARLAGAWVAPRTLVVDQPGQEKSLAWAVACLSHNIGSVVDLTPWEERTLRPAMRPGIRQLGDGTEATFTMTQERPLSLDDRIPGATVMGLAVAAQIEGQPVTRDVSQDPPSRHDAHRRSVIRPLEWIQVPLKRGEPVPPKVLVEIARLMHRHRTHAPADVVAVQSPGGDARAVVVAVADQLYSRFQQGRLTVANRTQVVRGLWTRVCTDYSRDLAKEPQQLASLLAMADLLLTAGPQPQR